jgi:hypothetical protein
MTNECVLYLGDGYGVDDHNEAMLTCKKDGDDDYGGGEGDDDGRCDTTI